MRAKRLGSLLLGGGDVEHAHDVALLHDQEIFTVDLDLGARPFAEQHAVADLEIDRDQLAGFVAAARAHGGDFALRGLFLGTVRNDDAASGLLFGVDALDHDAVVKRTEFHGILLKLLKPLGFLNWQSGIASAIHVANKDRKSTRLNSSHSQISYAVFCLKKKKRSAERRLQLYAHARLQYPHAAPQHPKQHPSPARQHLDR